MSFLYKHFGIPRKIDEFFDLASKGKPLDLYVKNDFIIIPPQHVVSYGLQSGKYSLTNEKYHQRVKLGKPLKNEIILSILMKYHNFAQTAIMTCEGLTGKGLTATVNGDSLERAKQKFNLLELRIMSLKDA